MSIKAIRQDYAGPVLRQGLFLSAGVICLWLLADRLNGADPAAVLVSLASVPPLQWLAGLLATGVSFWALGRYDLVLHGVLQTGTPRRRAARAGITAIALSQTLGFGLFTGALIRWKMLSGLAFSRAMALTGAVALCFLGSMAVILALVSLVFHSPVPLSVSLLILGGFALVLAISVVRPSIRLGQRRVRTPPLRALGAMLALTAVDVGAAAFACYIFMPDSIGYAQFLPVFLLAFGIGLVSGTPGGVGPFEVALLGLCPLVPQPEVLAAVLAFRVVYYALPACLALAVLTADHLRSGTPTSPRAMPAPAPALSSLRRAETAVVRQNGARITALGGTHLALLDTGQSLAALFDPLSGCTASALPQLAERARQRGLFPLIYKCNARTATAARSAGWRVARIAEEAVIDPAGFSLDGSAFRQLRRKLRQSERAGVDCARLSGSLPMAQMREVAATWAARQGGERGASMGRFCPDYVRNQLIFGAFQGEALIAFVTFHHSRHELCLDLLRSADRVPDGTMQTLICTAIEHARATGIGRLSLAAVPSEGRGIMRWLGLRLRAAPATAGLIRFKSAFAPRWQPLYAAAPDAASLAFGLADVARVIHAPDHLPHQTAPEPHRPHDLLENYEFATASHLWHPRPNT